MQLNYSILTCVLVAVASAVPKYAILSPPSTSLPQNTMWRHTNRTSQDIGRRAVGDVLAARASTKGSAAPAKASVAPAKNTVRAIPVVGARAVALQARASPTAKAQLQPKVLLRLRKLQLHQRRILLKLLLHLPKTPSELFLQGTRVWLECRI